MMPRPRLPAGPRTYRGRQCRTIPVATALGEAEVAAVDRAAASLGESRSEFVRQAIAARLETLQRPEPKNVSNSATFPCAEPRKVAP